MLPPYAPVPLRFVLSRPCSPHGWRSRPLLFVRPYRARDTAVSMSTSDLPASSVPPCVLLRGGASGPFVESGSRMCYHWEKILADRKRRTAPIYFSAPVCRRRCSIRTLHRLRSRSIADCWKMERWSDPIQPQSRMEHMGAVWAERGRTIQASGREPARQRRPPDRSAR